MGTQLVTGCLGKGTLSRRPPPRPRVQARLLGQVAQRASFPWRCGFGSRDCLCLLALTLFAEESALCHRSSQCLFLPGGLQSWPGSLEDGVFLDYSLNFR